MIKEKPVKYSGKKTGAPPYTYGIATFQAADLGRSQTSEWVSRASWTTV